MPEHRDILEERETLGRPFVGSLIFHGLLFGAIAGFSLTASNRGVLLGSPDPSAGSVVVQAATLPLPPKSGHTNPLANDSESPVPQKVEKTESKEKEREPEPDAIPIPSKKKDKKRAKEVTTTSKLKIPQNPNQVYSSTPQAVSSPMYGGKQGGGGVGIGDNSPFGTQFGWYAQLVRERIASKWHTDQIDARLDQAPPAVASFTLLRDGSAKDIRIEQSSGVSTIDFSAQRAILEASPFPPLPTGLGRDSARVEINFRFKR